ncbi:FtsK/SpoIIIE family DNA translocase [Amphibacillus xylanus]|uniref:Cell division protein FtsK n=1 Tax=Amphibacillus xylanus (strain ATCC 51415 / DSM 6626 / JCM 7361 / LMG 17667 / NBRC 15112 / Ep01) TaxID=698758 RepID=K0J4F2_AMPXN|nr:DNA translocase FtsK [Amphibacillus xylanus]BAM47576.1 cell division protein FtsK [Amphibacillus xylanus NBRC 15112]
MARKRKKKKLKISQAFKYELYGIICVLIAIFGSGAGSISDGIITSWLENSLRFLFGFWYMAASITLLIIGIYLMIKRKMPQLFTRKTFGLLISFIGLLLISHIDQYSHYLTEESQSIIRLTWQNYISFLDHTAEASVLGGGMIGALLYAFTYVLFSTTGAVFLAVFMIIIGTVFFFDISIDAFIKNRVKQFKTWQKNRKKEKRTKKIEKPKIEHQLPIEIEPEEPIEQEGPVIAAFTEVAYSEEVGQQSDQEDDEQDEDSQEIESLEVNAMTELENESYELPSIQLLDQPKNKKHPQDRKMIQQTVRKLETTFESFGVKAKVAKVHIGPAVTKYEVYPAAGVKVSKIVSLHDDIALALAAKDIRIEAPIPGKSAVGIEVPNHEVSIVTMREVFEALNDQEGSKLSFVLGRDISGDSIIAELNKMPHLLVAGATGSGKSVCINGIITSILMRAKPHEVKMMMIDPKKVELNIYNGIPHLLAPVVTDPKKAAQALQKVVAEMERRYDLFSDTGNRNIEGYNNFIKEYNTTASQVDQQPLLPYIVVLIDELADLMMVASKDVEDSITRLAQMARAAGIHLIIATQRPSVDVITGVIKANIPSRIAFSVSSQMDSRTILDMGGADKLLGRGDMLFLPVGLSKPIRIQGAFLSDHEVEKVVNHCINQQKAKYQEEMIPDDVEETQEEPDDELFDDAVAMVIEMQRASVSMLQRRFRIGYTRAARLIDMMEARGIVGPYEGSKPRKVLITEYLES